MSEHHALTENVLTLSEAAEFLRVSEKTLGQMARRGGAPGQRVGREWRFLRSALESWLAGESQNAHVGPRRPVSADDGKTVQPLSANGGGFKDTAFTLNREERLHRWVPWIAGFSAHFVNDILERAATAHGDHLTVLDPFAGVGTTLVEAMTQGHRPIGFEINPYAALATRLKLAIPDYNVAKLRSVIVEYKEFMSSASASRIAAPRSTPPVGFRSRVPFFSPSVERLVLFTLDFIESIRAVWPRDIFRLAFGAVMVSCSNYTYEPSLGTRQAAGKPNIDSAPVAKRLIAKLSEIAQDIDHVQEIVSGMRVREEPLLLEKSYLLEAKQVAVGSVDLLITSPPYLNNYHYIRNTRPQLYWLNLVHGREELRRLEETSFGKFWQTVRSGPKVALEFSYPALSRAISKVARQNPDKRVYGGQGWANYAATYFNDCARFCETSKRLLRPGATAVIVIGNNILQGVEIRSDVFLAGIAERTGFEVITIHSVRKKRTGSSIVNSSVRATTAKRRVALYESAVELRAPSH